MKLIKASDYKVMPWKNGGGETREVALGYGEQSMQHSSDKPLTPDWRVSIATISQSGPFSNFPNIDRTIALLKGDDVILTIQDRDKITLSQNGLCYSFPGEAAVYAHIVGSASTDLNIMTNRHYYKHHMQRLNQGLPKFDHDKVIKSILIATAKTNLTIDQSDIALDELDSLLFNGYDYLEKIALNDNIMVIIVMKKA